MGNGESRPQIEVPHNSPVFQTTIFRDEWLPLLRQYLLDRQLFDRFVALQVFIEYERPIAANYVLDRTYAIPRPYVNASLSSLTECSRYSIHEHLIAEGLKPGFQFMLTARQLDTLTAFCRTASTAPNTNATTNTNSTATPNTNTTNENASTNTTANATPDTNANANVQVVHGA